MSEKLAELINEYFDKDNYIIQTDTVENKEKLAVVYASSHNIYSPENEDGFIKCIVKKDNYEWFKTRIPFASKHIFIRDVSRRFYSFGINNNLNNLEKIAEFLKPELEGYKIITIGSSAGGTAAIMLGNLLNAEYVFAFSPIIRSYREDYPKDKIEEDLKNNKIFDITSTVEKMQTPIFYMYPAQSDFDVYTVNLIKNCQNIRFLPIECSVHGIPVNKRILRAIIGLNKKELEKTYKYNFDDSVNEYTFAKENWGLKMYFARVFDYVRKYPLFIFKKEFYNIMFKKEGKK